MAIRLGCLPVVYKKDRLPRVGYIVKWVHTQVTKGFWVFLVGFVGFCFFLGLLNVNQIKLIGMILVFLWGVYVWGVRFVLKYGLNTGRRS